MSDSGTFGSFGGRYVPEPLQEPLAELADAFDAAIESEEFLKRFGDVPAAERSERTRV